MMEFEGKALEDLDAEEFDRFIRQARLDAVGFVPGPVVPARALRVEQAKGRPARKLVWLVLDSRSDFRDALGDLDSVDEFEFEARGGERAVLVYRSTSPDHRLLLGIEPFQINDDEGTRSISQEEIEASRIAPTVATCASPFTREAHDDESIPLVVAYSLLVERSGETFSQEVYYFLARGHDDAIVLATTLGNENSTIPGSSVTRRFLYFTGFGGPVHGQVMFECTVPPGSAKAN